ncbi:PBECR2 nuclease fold domain-containing protein [Bdellovibrionota bacterium FG-2]
MSRTPTRKSVERRKKPRTRKSSARDNNKDSAPRLQELSAIDGCKNCGKDLRGSERALFVEEDLGRVFCSETCISAHFSPEIERLEKDYLRRLSPNDLSAEEREKYAHLRWITLQEADEVWREKTLSGDHRYTLISEFSPGTEKIWSVCICLFLRDEPSFLYLAFPTRSAALMNAYRKGERIRWEKPEASEGSESRLTQVKARDAREDVTERTDRLGEPWTEDETFLAQMNQDRTQRTDDDIQPEEFGLYEGFVDQTLENPDEVWVLESGAEPAGESKDPGAGDAEVESPRVFHFLKQFEKENPAIWYIIVARDTDEEEQIEILDAFPTRDPEVVERYRRGEQQVGGALTRTNVRTVH